MNMKGSIIQIGEEKSGRISAPGHSEIGINHEGSLETALEMVDAACVQELKS